MAVLLGLASALAYGLSDFVGGFVSRRAHYAIVAVLSYVAGGLTIVAVMALTGSPAPTSQALVWGAVSGLGASLGTLALYRGMARGRMGVVAPLSGLGTAVLPVLVGVVLGDRPSLPAWLGIAAALPAIWLVSTSSSEDEGTSRWSEGVADGLLAGIGFGVLLVALDLAGGEAGYWPVLASEAAGLTVMALFLLIAVVRGRIPDRRVAPDVLWWAAASGVISAAAIVAFHLSTQEGLLSIVAVLTALYPAATVALAAVVLQEPITRRQLVGLGLAVVAVVLIVVG